MPAAVAFAVLSLIGAASGASAQGTSYEYCIACTGPQAIYLCTVGPREPDPGAATWASYCSERIRSDVGHLACSSQPLSQSCGATRAFVFRGAQASPGQAEALTSEVPEERSSAAAEIWQQTVDGMRDVGREVEQGAEAVGEGARSVGDDVWDGLKAMGESMARGTECVVTLGESC